MWGTFCSAHIPCACTAWFRGESPCQQVEHALPTLSMQQLADRACPCPPQPNKGLSHSTHDQEVQLQPSPLLASVQEPANVLRGGSQDGAQVSGGTRNTSSADRPSTQLPSPQKWEPNTCMHCSETYLDHCTYRIPRRLVVGLGGTRRGVREPSERVCCGRPLSHPPSRSLSESQPKGRH